ncbi:C4-type zinc ribbon domain-containing protein [Deltaproteobacteria bacterium OttesenSCG-928-M10]|nr:C4-type zinc ribbon domain-containing protein [Deltaproteobacteria bacterium OttesenSCG-928-M10]
MNTTLNDLKNLQEVDDQLKAGRQALAEGAARLKEAGAGLKNFEARLAAAKADLAAMRARHRELEGEVADLSQKRRNNENRQMSVKNSNEYLALAKEAEFLNGRIGELEDETLELLDLMDKRELEISDLEAVVTEEAAAYGRTAEAIEKAAGQGRETLDSLEARRLSVIRALPETQLKLYDEIYKARGGRAVTPAADGLCLACRLGFPPQIFNELQRNEKIITCPNCARIIYWRDHPDFAAVDES